MLYLVGALVILIVVITIMYNRLVSLNNRCKNGYSQIDTQLKRRVDLIPNLVEITKGYARHESETLVAVVNARNEAISLSEQAKNSEEISKSLNKLLALSESYPDLKASELFKNLQIELTGTEDKIAFARQFYNDCVQLYNTAIEVFPNNILANMLKFQPRDFFKIDEADREVVKIEL